MILKKTASSTIHTRVLVSDISDIILLVILETSCLVLTYTLQQNLATSSHYTEIFLFLFFLKETRGHNSRVLNFQFVFQKCKEFQNSP